jgi:hypothetical protein
LAKIVSPRASVAPLVLAALAALLAGCAETGSTWQKPGADPENLKSDLGACHALADQTYGRMATAAPPVALNPRLGHADQPIRPTESRIKQQQMVDTCMREKGYRFEPPVAR